MASIPPNPESKLGSSSPFSLSPSLFSSRPEGGRPHNTAKASGGALLAPPPTAKQFVVHFELVNSNLYQIFLRKKLPPHSSVVVLEESPCPLGSSRTNFQVPVLGHQVLVLEDCSCCAAAFSFSTLILLVGSFDL